MAQFRQSGQHYHYDASDQGASHISVGIRNSTSQQKSARSRRSGRSERIRFSSGCSLNSLILVLCLALLFAVSLYYFLALDGKEFSKHISEDDDTKNDSDFLANVTRISSSKLLKFGRDSVSGGGDSRYWERDDRRRDQDYSEEDSEHSGGVGNEQSTAEGSSKEGEEKNAEIMKKGVGLYNEDGRKELKAYEATYVTSMEHISHNRANINEKRATEGEEWEEDADNDGISIKSKQKRSASKLKIVDDGLNIASSVHSMHASKTKHDFKKRPKRHPCEMKFLNISQIVEPFESRKFARFSLQYFDRDRFPNKEEDWEPKFAGHQTLEEREESFVINDKFIHCGFIKGPEGSPSTGFDLTEDDANYLSKCHVAVISCIFGNSDRLRPPVSKMVSRFSRKNVCFVMFMDELTLGTLSLENVMPDREGFIGLWKVVVVKNLPYTDMRRVGKVPKLLSHRLFPSARYSIWLDSKLRFQVDPLLVLEYFLWRKGHEYAISNHYDRHCVWEEVAQNKRLNKYNHVAIDEQFDFYRADGLKKFDPFDHNNSLPSNVPEGSLIVRAHTPMSNLFSCLWFNEVERFTPRDQLSFAYTYQKLRRMNPKRPFYLNMFKDCERRAIAKLFRHRSEEKRNISSKSSMDRTTEFMT